MQILKPNPTIPTPQIEKILLVFHVADFNTVFNSQHWKLYKSYLLYFRANPRSFDYMVNLAKAHLTEINPDITPDILLSDAMAETINAENYPWLGHIWSVEHIDNSERWNPNLQSKLQKKDYDTVIFLYPDATGIDWEKTERTLLQFGLNNYLVINGRKRFFVLDREAHKMLLRRRFLAKSWLLEAALAILLWPVSGALALWDSIFG